MKILLKTGDNLVWTKMSELKHCKNKSTKPESQKRYASDFVFIFYSLITWAVLVPAMMEKWIPGLPL